MEAHDIGDDEPGNAIDKPQAPKIIVEKFSHRKHDDLQKWGGDFLGVEFLGIERGPAIDVTQKFFEILVREMTDWMLECADVTSNVPFLVDAAAPKASSFFAQKNVGDVGGFAKTELSFKNYILLLDAIGFVLRRAFE